MGGGLLKRWGLGIELSFDAGRATAAMGGVGQRVAMLRDSTRALGTSMGELGGRAAALGAALAPIALGVGLVAGRGSQLAGDLEAQMLTMRVLLGDAAKAETLIALIRQNAAETPFEEGDLIEGSKRLLRLTGQNVDRNMELLKVMETMAALSPGKTVVDAVEALLDATSGGGFERLKEFGLAFKAEDFEKLGRPGGEAWAKGVSDAIGDRLKVMTRGENLVAALSQTFSGRLSTAKDAINNLVRDIGITINREIGPTFAPFGEAVGRLGPMVRAGAEILVREVKGIVARGQPFIDRIAGWWTGLGEEGQAKAVALAMGIATLIAVLLPVGGAIGAVGFALSSVIGLLTGAWGVISAVGGALAALASPTVILAIGAVAAAAALLFGVFREEGEGPVAFVERIGRAVWTFLIGAFERGKVIVAEFSEWFSASFEGFGPLITRVREPILALTAKFAELGSYLAGDGVSMTFWRSLGQFFGWLANVALRQVGNAIRFVVAVLDVLTTSFRPLFLVLSKFVEGLIGIVTGSMSASRAVEMMVGAVAGAFAAVINGVFSLMIGAIEIVLRFVFDRLGMLPGVGDWLKSKGTSVADAMASARQGFEREVSKAIAGIDLAQNAKVAATAEAASPVVNVAPPAVENTVNVNASLKVDSAEIARADASHKVKAGQKTGQNMPAQARGKVLRGNGTITALDPSEVL